MHIQLNTNLWKHSLREQKLINHFKQTDLEAFADPNRGRLERGMTQFDQLKVNKDEVLLVLTNSSERKMSDNIWRIADNVQNAIQNILNQWKKGDNIQIQIIEDHYSQQDDIHLKKEPLVKGRFILKNMNNSSFVFVDPLKEYNHLYKAYFLKQKDPSGRLLIGENEKERFWEIGSSRPYCNESWDKGRELYSLGGRWKEIPLSKIPDRIFLKKS